MHTFDTPSPVRLKLSTTAGRVRVEASDTVESTVELSALHPDAEAVIEQAIVDQRDDTIVIELPRERGGLFRSRKSDVAIDVHVPAGSSVRAELRSADLRTVGELYEVSAKLGSGDATIDVATGTTAVSLGSGDLVITRCDADFTATTGSGDVSAAELHGASNVRAGSGDLAVRDANAPLSVKTGSGDVAVRHSAAAVTVKAASGDVRIGGASAGEIAVMTASGDVDINVADGVAAWLDLHTISGQIRNDLDTIDNPDSAERSVEVRVQTASGGIGIGRA